MLAATFGLPRSKACEHAHRLAQAPERTLRALGVLPARAIDSLAQMQALFADVPMLLLDATERPCRRQHAAGDWPADYSGKKGPTRKNTLIHARRRIKVEHAISGAKCLGCVIQVYRDKSRTFNGRVMLWLAVSGIGNSPKRKKLFGNKS